MGLFDFFKRRAEYRHKLRTRGHVPPYPVPQRPPRASPLPPAGTQSLRRAPARKQDDDDGLSTAMLVAGVGYALGSSSGEAQASEPSRFDGGGGDFGGAGASASWDSSSSASSDSSGSSDSSSSDS